MCGFGGAINHFRELTASQVGQIASQVGFRGPDSCGVKVLDSTTLKQSDSGRTALFFNRLAIVDLDSRSNQPFEDADHLLVFNGEIYNYKELKSELNRAGFQFRTTSDTEVLFFALKYWKENALVKLNGMFAFFWLDKKEKTFIVGRDRLGIKPLYYSQVNGGFYFSSELHSIVRLAEQIPPLSTRSVNMYLWMQFIPTPNTIFERIYKLPPGCFIKTSVDDTGSDMHTVAYWNTFDAVQSPISKDPESLETVLKESLHRQLQADVPLGLFLSSGVDSSLLAAIVNKYFAQEQVNFFTVSFNEKTTTDESRDAAEFISGFNNPNLKNHLLTIDASFLAEHIHRLYDFYDEPFGDYASLLNWVISTKARELATVVISGDGADELFWGYSRYNRWQQIKRLNSVPFLSATASIATKVLPPIPVKKKLQKVFGGNSVKTHFDLFLLPGFAGKLPHIMSHKNIWALENIEQVSSREDLPLLLDIKTYLADAMLYKVDRSSMASSLEVRVPYLDNEVLEFALHTDMKNKSNKQYQNKAILKQLLSALAPHYDVNKPKKGFSFPLKKWLKENWKESVLDVVDSNLMTQMGLEPKPFLKLVNDFYSKDTNAAVEVWYLFNLALWNKKREELKNQLST